MTSFFNGSERVSSGMEDELSLTMKQSSIDGSLAPNVKDLLASMPLYGAGPLVGIPPASSGR